MPTLSPTPLETQRFFTTLDYTHVFYGHMFDISALKDISVTSLEFQTTSTNTETIQVWTKDGTYVGYETNDFVWALIGEIDVVGQGTGQLTALPRDLFGRTGWSVRAGMKRSFFIVARDTIICFQERFVDVNGTKTHLINYGEKVYENEDMEINVGTGVQYGFINNGPPNVFNGVVEYVVRSDEESV
eukprot:CAMPEP_0194040196 /NCGR_PEP_ID=MMETSP0009_2-20130614/12243_1 /TAXON_ID=210454 /ORGANISM="Grammatophora oceanica, Strain CCMP 410" /LENGTH=186 /DNA_ID=CAMNT_0038683265 /DNA_START=1 /DNA_END=561 /DNA_ORIENTATION=-